MLTQKFQNHFERKFAIFLNFVFQKTQCEIAEQKALGIPYLSAFKPKLKKRLMLLTVLLEEEFSGYKLFSGGHD